MYADCFTSRAARQENISFIVWWTFFLHSARFASDLLPRKSEVQCKSGSELVGARFWNWMMRRKTNGASELLISRARYCTEVLTEINQKKKLFQWYFARCEYITLNDKWRMSWVTLNLTVRWVMRTRIFLWKTSANQADQIIWENIVKPPIRNLSWEQFNFISRWITLNRNGYDKKLDYAWSIDISLSIPIASNLCPLVAYANIIHNHCPVRRI